MEDTENVIFSSNLTLEENSEFSIRFNKVSDTFKKYQNLEKQTYKALKNYEDLKYCLEQGLPI